MSNILEVHKARFTHQDISGYMDDVRAACIAGFNASPEETPPEHICNEPLLKEWFVTGQQAAKYVDHVKVRDVSQA